MDVDAPTLNRWLQDGDELAVLDAREQGVYFRSHLFHAACIPLSQLELVLPQEVPWGSGQELNFRPSLPLLLKS